jgi:hypothetical protein
VHSLHQTYHRLSNRFGCTRWYFEVTRLKWKLILVHLDIVLLLMQDRCIIYTELTIGSKIILVTPMEHLGDVGHVNSCFGPFGDGVRVRVRLVHGFLQT